MNDRENLEPVTKGVALSLKLILLIAMAGLGLIVVLVVRQPNRRLPEEDRERLARLGQALLQYVELQDGTYPFSLKPVVEADDRIVAKGWNRSVLDKTPRGWANEYRLAKVRMKIPALNEYPLATSYFDSVLDFEDVKGFEMFAMRTKRSQCARERQDGFAVMPSRCEWNGTFALTCDGAFWRLNFDGSVTSGKIKQHMQRRGLLKDLQSQSYAFDHLAFFTDGCPIEDFLPKR